MKNSLNLYFGTLFGELLVFISCQQLPATRGTDLGRLWGGSTTTRAPNSPLRENEVVVTISQGRVIGRRLQLKKLPWTPDRDPREKLPPDRGPLDVDPLPPQNDVTVYAFLGIPYAEPPLGNRRFKPPQKLTRFPGPEATLQALQYREACAQDIQYKPTFWYKIAYEWNTDEDCLYLNIFTPAVSKSSIQNYPVLVFLHGGGFQTGASNDWPGELLATKGLVVVTANYRLGPFGFMCLGDSETGNYGLLDQRLVLEWVRDHIYEFHGDPGSVTLAGHGAGAVSAELHMLSPGSQNLFKSVIAMSGSATSYQQVIRKPDLAFNNTIKLGRQAGCTQITSGQVWSCLLTRSTNDLIQSASSMIIEYNRYAFLPTVDGQVLPADPETLMNPSDPHVASPVTYLTGINKNDGTEVLLSDRSLAKLDWRVDEPYLRRKIREYIIQRNYTTNREAIEHSIRFLYTYWPETWNEDRTRQEFIKFSSDALYVAPVSKSAQLHSSTGSFVFMYINNYNFSKGALNPDAQFLPYWMDACHECDLYLLFGFPWLPKERLPEHLRGIHWTDVDKNASEVFMAMFRQFARTMNPNLPLETIWQNYAPRKHLYLDFNYTSRVLKRDYEYERVAFWNEYIHKLAMLFTTTLSPTVAGLRRELVGYKVTVGVVVFLLCLVLVLTGAFAYLLFERRQTRRMPLMDYSQSYPTNDYPAHRPPQTGAKV